MKNLKSSPFEEHGSIKLFEEDEFKTRRSLNKNISAVWNLKVGIILTWKQDQGRVDSWTYERMKNQ